MPLFCADDSKGWTVARRVSRGVGHAKVVSGAWLEVQDDVGNLIGFRVKVKHRDDGDVPTRGSSASISVVEMEIYAGRHFRKGKSRTAHLDEEQRQERVSSRGARFLEDTVERVTAKVEMYPAVTEIRVVSVDAVVGS